MCADPPWKFKTRTAIKAGWRSPRNTEIHYETMSLDAIKALPVRDLAAPTGCHLFLWTTGPNLRQAFEVIDAWGFKYSGIAFLWAKLRKKYDPNQLRALPTIASDFHTGLGMTTRKNTELCLLARRGNCKRAARDVRELILSPVREHSRKPEEYRDRVERYVGPGTPIVELFARNSRPGWTTWGNEATKFDTP